MTPSHRNLVPVRARARVHRHSRRDRYTATSPSALINHLLSRNLHLLALRVSQHLGLRPDPVLKHWATAKISRGDGEGDDDEVVCRAIVDKFEKEGEKGVSYADIAKKAWEAGRSRLATMVSTLRAAGMHMVLMGACSCSTTRVGRRSRSHCSSR